jgi:hypothetical protein
LDLQLPVTGQWFSSGAWVSSINKSDCHDIAEILLKVALNTINLPNVNIEQSKLSFNFNDVLVCHSQVVKLC